jgi:hypothetical protein
VLFPTLILTPPSAEINAASRKNRPNDFIIYRDDQGTLDAGREVIEAPM